MKRGKGEEKMMGPMFPRLHVNDTEKGGPRAPPRNKMALYEQLSIPSHGVFSLNPNTASDFIHPSSAQGNGHERRMFLPLHLAPSAHSSEKLHAHSSDSNTPLTQFESRKKTDEDDFRVPVFNSNMSQVNGKFCNISERGKVSPSNQAFPARTTRVAKHTRDENLKKQESLKQLPASREQSVKDSLYSPSTDKNERYIQHTDFPLDSEQRDVPANNSGLLQKSGTNLQPESIVDSKVGGTNDVAIVTGPIKGVEVGDSSVPINGFQTEEQIINLVNDTESQGNQTCRSPQIGNVDRGDNSSETSMVECISGMDISPDDVVGIIGQKHFWKARRAIVKSVGAESDGSHKMGIMVCQQPLKDFTGGSPSYMALCGDHVRLIVEGASQQRVFAVQVFELHRLMKVQKLIAESPNLLLEDTAYIGQPLKVSPAKRLPFEYVIKAPQNVTEHKNDSEKPHLRMECSAENIVAKASLSSVQNATTQSPRYKPSLAVVSNESNMGPWGFHQPSGHQWLIPVMTPSEGLVYKPYPGPGFTSPSCGNCGPPGPTPVMGNFFPPTYGVPPPQYHYRGAGHGYFPPYGMPAMNPAVSTSAVEQMNPFTGTVSQVQGSDGGINVNVQRQSSCNKPISQKNGAVSDGERLHACKDNELQASCASSPSERAQGVTTSAPMDGRSMLPLFPTSPVAANMDADIDHPARVIRVVPHNPRSASESAARIFQCIQKERKQYDATVAHKR